MLHKARIHEYCIELLNDKITGIHQLIADARAASNDDTKSSMGDKYETTREMMQIEIDKLQYQLADAQNQLLGLKVLDASRKCEKAEPGALVSTDKGVFYIAVGLGKVVVGNESVMVISPASPIGKIMLGNTAGSSFTLNQSTYNISEIG